MEREDLSLAVLCHLGTIGKAPQDHATMRRAFAFANDDTLFRKLFYLNTQGTERCNIILVQFGIDPQPADHHFAGHFANQGRVQLR
jgi:hypothetical protein